MSLRHVPVMKMAYPVSTRHYNSETRHYNCVSRHYPSLSITTSPVIIMVKPVIIMGFPVIIIPPVIIIANPDIIMAFPVITRHYPSSPVITHFVTFSRHHKFSLRCLIFFVILHNNYVRVIQNYVFILLYEKTLIFIFVHTRFCFYFKYLI